jgi:hypothetical protein
MSWPVVLGRCADCDIGTYTIGEWYMVRDEIWEAAWAGRRKPWHRIPGQEVLCIGLPGETARAHEPQRLHRFGGGRSQPEKHETVGRGKNQEQQPQGLR